MRFQQFIDSAAKATARASRAFGRFCLWAAPRVFDGVRRGVRHAALTVWNSRKLRAALRPVASVARIGAVAAAIAFVSVTALRATTQIVTPTEIGVIQKDWGDGAGVVAGDIGPSKRFVIPGVATLHRLNRRVHFVRFGMKSEGDTHPSLELRTPEDLEVRVGATVPYRIQDGKAHRIVEDGIRSTYPDLARAAIERVLLDELAALGREQWSDVASREAVEATALASIAVGLEPFHLEPLGVYLSSTWFPSGFEMEVMEQKLLEQRILTDAMLARRDERKYEHLTEREVVEGAEAARASELDFAIEQERVRLQRDVEAIEQEAAAYAFERKTVATNTYEKALTSGRLAVDQAEALRERLVNEALESDGGRVMVAREAAKNLRFNTVKLDANNPNVPSILDLDALISLLLGGG